MSGQIGRLSESLGTDVTAVGFFAAVRSHVSLEGGGSRVTLTTNLANVVAFVDGFLLRL